MSPPDATWQPFLITPPVPDYPTEGRHQGRRIGRAVAEPLEPIR